MVPQQTFVTQMKTSKMYFPDCEKGKPLPIPMSPLNVVCAPDSASRPRMSMPVELFQSSNSHRLQLVIAPAVNFHPLYILPRFFSHRREAGERTGALH